MAETTSNSNLDTALIDAIELDLNGVDAAMERLEKGTYFTDEITGAPLQSDFLTANPLARRNP
jgi:RNA polymerase-binding transcription factor DksA